jgi:hypothetical protein
MSFIPEIVWSPEVLTTVASTDTVLLAVRLPIALIPSPPVSVRFLSAAPISASVHATFAEPFTDLPVAPIVIVLAVPQFAVVILAEPLKEVPFIVLAVWSAVAVPAFPDTDPVIVELNVFTPANVWFPVVITPDADAVAVGSVAFVPVDEVTIGPAVVPAVMPRFVATLTCAPAAIPSNFVLSALVINPASDVVAAGIVALVPVELLTVPVVVAVLYVRFVAGTLTVNVALVPWFVVKVWLPVAIPDVARVSVALFTPMSERLQLTFAVPLKLLVVFPIVKLRAVCKVLAVSAATFVRPEPLPVNILEPILILPNPEEIEPALRTPTPVREELTTPDPNVLLVKTVFPAIL